jgi:hypothetical protein
MCCLTPLHTAIAVAGVILNVGGCCCCCCSAAVTQHTALLLWEHFRFSLVDLGSGNFAIALQLRFPLGKGALQSQQDVPLMSKFYNWEVRGAGG